MKILDLMGQELEVGSVVAVKHDGHIVGVVVKVEDGTLAKGVSVAGQPKGELQMPHAIVRIEMTVPVAALPNGMCPPLLKLPKQEEKKALIN